MQCSPGALNLRADRPRVPSHAAAGDQRFDDIAQLRLVTRVSGLVEEQQSSVAVGFGAPRTGEKSSSKGRDASDVLDAFPVTASRSIRRAPTINVLEGKAIVVSARTRGRRTSSPSCGRSPMRSRERRCALQRHPH